jgi:DNA-directed RNA polymerase specialized sigma24 family protein
MDRPDPSHEFGRRPPSQGLPVSPDGSVSRWLAVPKNGDAAAAQPLWERYHRRIVTLARRKLQSARRSADEEDVVQSAFHSFFRGVIAGRFPRLDDRDDLWRLLVVITAREALDQLARENSQERGGGTPRADPRIPL